MVTVLVMPTGAETSVQLKDVREPTLTVMDMESVTREPVNASVTLAGKVRTVVINLSSSFLFMKEE